MGKRTLTLVFSCFYFVEIFSFINPKLICSVYTPDSILNHKEKYKPYFLGSRKRYATCTGATWFHGNYLAVLNLYGEKIITYRFDEEKNQFSQVQLITSQDGARLKCAENLSVSPDGTLLAVCSDNFGLSIYTIDSKSHLINPVPIFLLPCRGLIHNVRFSFDGAYLAFTSWDSNASICIYKVVNNQNYFDLELVYKGSNKAKLLRTKSVNFTRDGKYIILV